jgi:hypothetical protein
MAETEFVPDTVLKRDAFSETVAGHDAAQPARRLALRRLSGLPWWSRALARRLARREVAGLAAVRGIEGVPELIRADREGILRTWADGTPLNRARPSDPAWYRDARRLLRQMRRRGVAHNDLAKPQNWLVTPEGRAAVIDFQLASVHPRRGRLFRALAWEDLRHLVKQKRAYARAHLTPTERRLLARRALPSRIWMATGKPVYVFVTRRLLNWRDAEGAEGRATEAEALLRALRARPDVREAAVIPYPRAAGGVGLYAFVETDAGPEAFRALVPRPDLLHPVAALPRGATGALRDDLLELVAANRVEEIPALLARVPAPEEEVAALVAGRLNLTDRQLKRR